MGRMIIFLTILIFIDLFFLATGQICSVGDCTLSSILFNAILNIGNLSFTQLFSELIGDLLNKTTSLAGILSLGVAGGVTVGAFYSTKEFRLLLIPMVLSLALIASDFVTITVYLSSISPVLAIFIMAPLSIIYVVTVVEWFIGKD